MIGLIWLLSVVFSAEISAKVYYSKQEALDLAFGKEATVEMVSLFLTDAQRKAIERLGHIPLESNLFTFYVGKRGGKTTGYAAIETHTVRTKPETLLVVLSPEGHLQKVVVLAFHEPPEYEPPGRWFAQLNHVAIGALRLGGGVEGITGATLSARASLDSVRKVRAIYEVAVAGRETE
ncbi:MAG: FMN-binding protein [Methylothermaceae bacterium]|nr:FMN-binding protein [Methylothermaceae bacterium]